MSRIDSRPQKGTADPQPVTYPAGTLLHRVHEAEWAAHLFNPTAQDVLFGGNRFGSTREDRYSYLYAAPDPATAVVETLVRRLEFGPASTRIMPFHRLEGRLLSEVELTREVRLVSLVGAPDLAAVRQEDYWLVHSEETDFPFTRVTGHWLRAEAPWADGLVWLSNQNRAERAMVFFGPVEGDAHTFRTTGRPPLALDSDEGVDWLNDLLRPFRTTVGPRTPYPGA